MNDSECAKAVLDWAIREAMTSSLELSKAMLVVQHQHEAVKSWDSLNPDDGVGSFSGNPYRRDSEYLIKKQELCSEINTQKQAILEFIKIKICGLI